MNVADRLKKLRKSLDLTQKQFANRVPGKLDQTYIGKIERGQYPSLKLLERIGGAFSVPISYFFQDGRESRKGSMSYIEVLDWLNEHETQAEGIAQRRLFKGKFMMYGYWKAIAVHIRRMKREFQSLSQGEKG